VANISLPDTATVGDLKKEITSATSLPMFDLKSGFPPKALDLDQFDDELKLSDTGMKLNNEQLIATPHDIAGPLKHTTHPDNPASNAATNLPPASKAPPPPARRPIRSSAPLPLTREPNDVSTDPPELPFPLLSGTLVLRIMPDDNSCLFRAFSSAALGSSLDSMHELRSLVAGTIQSQPELYNEGILEKKPDAYCSWIQRDDAWGGGIELGILSQQFDLEICSINVQDLRIDRFNEQANRRAILVYSGIHYDVIALSPSEDGGSDMPPEFDTKVFEEGKEEVLAGAVELCRILQGRHYFTDTKGFAIKCNNCGWTGNGEKAATEHAKGTGHYDFGEA
jgi:ubiquitin thioesterase OTU1